MALEELEALEAFLASNPNELNNLLDKPFGELAEQLCYLGFDGKLLRHYICGLEDFSKEVWIDAVGIDSIEHFLHLTPHQYCDSYPEIGAPLLVAVVNSIKISDQHAQLLREAGGTNLSKKQKLGLEIGLPVAATALYFAPRVLGHQNAKKLFFESLSPEKLEEVARGEINERVLPGEKGVIELKQTIFGTHMDVKFESWSDRVAYELRHTSPYIVWKSWSTRKELQAKKAEKAEKKAMQAEERKLANQAEHRGAKFREHLRDIESDDMETIDDLSSEEEYDILKDYGSSGGRGELLKVGNNWEDFQKNFTSSYRNFQARFESRFSERVVNKYDARASGFLDNLDGFEDKELSVLQRRLSSEISSYEDALEQDLERDLMAKAAKEVDSYKGLVDGSIKKIERAVDKDVMEIIDTGKEIDPLKDL